MLGHAMSWYVMFDVLVFRCKDSVKHYKVTWNGDCYAFGLATFKSYDEFISHFQKQPFIAGESGTADTPMSIIRA